MLDREPSVIHNYNVNLQEIMLSIVLAAEYSDQDLLQTSTPYTNV